MQYILYYSELGGNNNEQAHNEQAHNKPVQKNTQNTPTIVHKSSEIGYYLKEYRSDGVCTVTAEIN